MADESRGAAQGGIIGGLAYLGAVGAAGVVAMTGGAALAAVAAAAAAGGAGALGGLGLSKLIDEQHAKSLEEQLDQGGLLLWVKVEDEAAEKRAVDILSGSSSRPVSVHQF